MCWMYYTLGYADICDASQYSAHLMGVRVYLIFAFLALTRFRVGSLAGFQMCQSLEQCISFDQLSAYGTFCCLYGIPHHRLLLLFYAASQDFSYKSDRVSQKFVHLHPLCTQNSRAMQSRPETTAQTSRKCESVMTFLSSANASEAKGIPRSARSSQASDDESKKFYFSRPGTPSPAPKPNRIILLPRNEDVVHWSDIFAELKSPRQLTSEAGVSQRRPLGLQHNPEYKSQAIPFSLNLGDRRN
ncbi:hypothetical protein BKA56DRAFT_653759 [Ilyonectria sp. MPI-CAGE-AT-0026]|nr:hypothetical protein BKA56DRAFT_653759 [Ilyonectria sp. MPI-CAGE-AT-0026]